MNGANVAWSGVVYAFIYLIQFGVLTAKKIVARAHAKSRTANLSDSGEMCSRSRGSARDCYMCIYTLLLPFFLFKDSPEK